MYCPQCGKQVLEIGLYCSGCGTRLEKVEEDSQSAAWIAAMQERIKYARQENLLLAILSIIGVIAFILPFGKFVWGLQTSELDSTLLSSGIVAIIAGLIGLWRSDKKIKELIDQLEKGK